MRSDFHMPGRPGGYAGKPHCLSATLANAFIFNMLSGRFSAKGELRFMTSRTRLSAALFIEFLRRLIAKFIFAIVLTTSIPTSTSKNYGSSRYGPFCAGVLFGVPIRPKRGSFCTAGFSKYWKCPGVDVEKFRGTRRLLAPSWSRLSSARTFLSA